MKLGAVIVAAGMSKRMKSFKPLLEVDGVTFAERIIQLFQRAGIEEIVMVTGFQAQELEDKIRYLGIKTIRNEQYETTQMLDSVRLGLDYIKDRCDSVLFSPVDAPFGLSTLKKVMDAPGEIVAPVYEDYFGHPIRFDKKFIPRIMKFRGNGGLRGALASIEEKEYKFLYVDDVGVAMDADNPEAYEAICNYAMSGAFRPLISSNLAAEEVFFGPHMITLLIFVDLSGSLREACKLAGVSYSKGRNMVKQAEHALGFQLVESKVGGATGGTSTVSLKGKILVNRFKEFEKQLGQYGYFLYNKSMKHVLEELCTKDETELEQEITIK